MCEIFVGANPALYEVKARSLRLHGASTSIRLENLFWSILEEIGGRDGLSLNQLLTRLYDELTEVRGDVGNFASFLRVSCARYLALQVSGRIPEDRAMPLRGLDAAWVLSGDVFGSGVSARNQSFAP
ncbi:MAG TPA: ribbon-helix-helix domain-containing protein [Candidatus Sulfotelmatobacter sp.]|jgi:predicted DNA-binding ribbon-helix-helix protein|nr:ribbon-helix-helix domain-containing protein [Candidatus Sulfotelmatobacter sp.]